MPPADQPQPSTAERIEMIEWISTALADRECAGPRDAGRVTLRRLNRFEYNNTIRDLVGIDFRPADDFPSDDVGEGFDNIGDVLTLPPLLLEKYLAAAQQIVERALACDGPNLVAPEIPGNEVLANDRHPFFAPGEVRARLNLPADGHYVIRLLAYGEQAGWELPKLALTFDKEPLCTFDVAATQDEPQLYEAWVTASAGRHTLGVNFPNDYYRPKDPPPNDRNLIAGELVVTGPHPATYRQIIPREHTPEDRDALAQEIIARYASLAFRRPARPEEIDRLLKLVDLSRRDGESFASSLGVALQAILVSPHFLFRVEDDGGRPADEISEQINDWELATRLSYFLWSSMPDEELFEHARAGTLRWRDNLRDQVRRMLTDEKSIALAERFAGQWLSLGNLSTAMPNAELFPGFDDELREAMARETELSFVALLREDRSVLELIDADSTFVNERLARHYGIAGVRGDDFRRVKVDRRQRGGLLTQAGVLTVTSNPTRTSPVKRGKWIMESILGTPPPPPPPEVPALEEGNERLLAATLRERMAEHRSRAECAVCHQGMDPLGLGLENFDAIGAWRVADGLQPIDASGKLPTGETFESVAELKELLLAHKTDFVRALARKLLTYGLGRGLLYSDECVVNDIVARLAEDDYRMASLIVAIVESEPFQGRPSGGQSP